MVNPLRFLIPNRKRWALFLKSIKLWIAIWLFAQGLFSFMIAAKAQIKPEYYLEIVLANAIVFLLVYIIYLKKESAELAKMLDRMREQELKPGFFRSGKRTLMCFDYDEDRAILSYEGERNISLRVATINTVFEVMLEHNKEKGELILREIGGQIGGYFAIEFRKYLVNKRRQNFDWNHEKKIDEWCKYDELIGFGKLDNRTTYVKGRLQGNRHIVHSFLTHERDLSDQRLCAFLQGYIQGFLNKIENRIDEDIRVKEVQCDRDNLDVESEGCRFEISYVDPQEEKKTP